MAKALEMMLEELRQEAATTRRVLERVPAEKLGWKPHPKSMSLGQLALHVAKIPGGVSRMAQLEEFDPSKRGAEPDSPKDVVGGKEVFRRPRIGVLRVMLLNHWYHHRGQLAVYLRMLDVPVPAIYGRSADEGP